MNLTMVTTGIFRQLSRLPRHPLSFKFVGSTSSNLVKYWQQSLIRNCHRSKFEGYFNVSEKSVSKLKLKDNVPEKYILIYKSPVENYVRLGYPALLFIILAAPIAVLYSFYIKGQIMFSRESNTKVFFHPEVEIWVFACGLVTCAACFFGILFKLPFRIYKHSVTGDYRAIFLSVVPLKVQHVHFISASKTKFKNPIYCFTPDCHYFVGKKRAIIFPHCFRTPADFCKMVGID